MNIETQSFADLISLLEEEAEIYTQLADLLDQERECLIRMAASALGEICSTKETLCLRIRALDESRNVMSERLGRQLGIAAEEVTVTELCRLAPPDLARRLDRARDLLKERGGRCKAVNEYNSRAARRGLDLVDGAIEYLLGGADPTEKLYQKKGGYAGGRPAAKPALVSREV